MILGGEEKGGRGEGRGGKKEGRGGGLMQQKTGEVGKKSLAPSLDKLILIFNPIYFDLKTFKGRAEVLLAHKKSRQVSNYILS